MQQRGVVHPDMVGVVVAQNAVSIVFTKPAVNPGDGTVTPAVDLAAQIVRIAYDNSVAKAEGAAGTAPVLNAQVYAETGVDIAEGYTFLHAGNRFRVSDIVPVAGGIHAYCMAIG